MAHHCMLKEAHTISYIQQVDRRRWRINNLGPSY
jgi:hypothetical protein